MADPAAAEAAGAPDDDEPTTTAAAAASGSNPHRDRLVRYYEKYAPEKLAEVDVLLEKFKGREDSMFDTLVKKYGPEPGSSSPQPQGRPPAEAAAAGGGSGAASSPKPTEASPKGRLEGVCIHCGVNMGNFLGSMTAEGPIHNECIPVYKRTQIERCAHCDCVLREARSVINGKKIHPECVTDFKAKKPYEPPRKEGVLMKFAVGRSFFSGKNWKERYFVLSKQTGLAYYENKQAFQTGKPPKNAVMLTGQVRMITKPTRYIHKDASNPSKELIIVFFEGGQERRLLVAAKNFQEHDEWVRTLESYIKNVDDPRDIREA